MGLLDPLFKSLARLLDILDNIIDGITDPQVGDEEATGAIARTMEQVTPADELGGVVVDLLEEFVISELDEEGQLKPENVEAVVDDTEGAAVAVLVGVGLAASAVEAASLGQIDKHQEWLTQAIAGLGVDDVTGLELDARIQEGVQPALEAKVGKEHRSKFADVQDAIELLLRNKTGDVGFLQGTNVDDIAARRIQSNNPINPDNLLEEWGLRDDQLPILEEVALEQMEFEELIETPAELGLVVDEELLEQELDRVGYSEDLKEFLLETADALPRSARTYQELLTTEEYVRQLDTLTSAGVIQPADAEALIPDEVPAEDGVFQERFQLLKDLPAGVPSASDIEGAFASGYIGLGSFRELLDQTDYPTDQYSFVLKKQVLDELDGDLQTSLGLGLITDDEFSNLAQFAGLDLETTVALARGQSLDKIAKRRLQEETAPEERPVTLIQGIGEARSTSLGTIGIETVADLAEGDVDQVAETAQVSPETAETWINLARQASS